MKLRIADLINVHGYCIRAFLFDLDGTLVDSSKAIVNAVKAVLDPRGHFYDGENIAKIIGMPLEEMFRVLVQGLSKEEVWRYVREYRRHYSTYHLESTTVHLGVASLLRKLKEQDLKLGLVTTKYRKFTLEVLAHFNLIGLFDTVVTGYDVKRHKPAPDIVLEAARRLGVDSSNCAVVGDSPMDIEAGRRAGALTIAVLTGPYSRLQMQNAKPNFILENLEFIH